MVRRCTRRSRYTVLYHHTMHVISLSNISIKTNFKQIARVELKCVQYSEGDYIMCMTSKVACLIQDVSPHCGDKRMAQFCTRRSLPNYFDMTSYHWNVRQNTVT
jgi:hypothetical protein